MYTLTFTEQETDSIDFVGYRYSWSAALQKLLAYDDDGKPETISLQEHEAWELVSAFEADTEGGHSFFPMLDHRSELARKLFHFLESIV
jgi:hypothetical protein